MAQHHQLDSRHAWLAQLPMRLGGCGLRSALRTAPAAWWASWADTLPMIRARHPEVAERLYQQLQGNRVATPSVAAVQEAQRHLAEKGYQCPEWDLVWNGARPDQGSELEPGEWKHGWQYYAASRLETEFRAGAVLSSADYSSNAFLRSQAGRASGAHLSASPVNAARTWQLAHLRLVLLRRLR